MTLRLIEKDKMMIDYETIDPLRYVTATAPLIGLKLSGDRLNQVAEAFALVIRMAKPALDVELPEDTEPAPVFCASSAIA